MTLQNNCRTSLLLVRFWSTFRTVIFYLRTRKRPEGMKYRQKVKRAILETDLKVVSFFLLFGLISAKENIACCSFPCQNGGECLTIDVDDYKCDCYGLQFYGKNCEIPTWSQQFYQWLQPDPELLYLMATKYQYIWNIFNSLKNSLTTINHWILPNKNPHEFIKQSSSNHYLYSLILPSVPKNCPTPLGVAGSKTLPEVNRVAELFKRSEFKPEPMGFNLLFATFAEHFSYMFFKTSIENGPDFTWSSQSLDLSNIYGREIYDQNILRSFNQGKLKSQIIDGEEWPPLLEKAPVKMYWPNSVPIKYRFALGHEYLSIHPGHLMWSTLWLRQHNRLCDILTQSHPNWRDEQLYQTSRQALNAIMSKMVLEEWLTMFSPYELNNKLGNMNFQYQKRMFLEYKLFSHYHGLIPDHLSINNTIYTTKNFFFNPEILFKHGMPIFIESLIKQSAGRVGHHNYNPATIYVVVDAMIQGRKLRLQSYNNYCRHFGIKPPKTFLELTGDYAVAKELEELYKDVESIELFVGVMCSRREHRSLFNILQLEFGVASVLYANNPNLVISKKWWQPSTFGGQEVFNIIEKSTFQRFICNNIKGHCPHFSFKVPWWNQDYEKSFYMAELAANRNRHHNLRFDS